MKKRRQNKKFRINNSRTWPVQLTRSKRRRKKERPRNNHQKKIRTNPKCVKVASQAQIKNLIRTNFCINLILTILFSSLILKVKVALRKQLKIRKSSSLELLIIFKKANPTSSHELRGTR